MKQQNSNKWRLIRLNDGRVFHANTVKWVEWALDGTGAGVHEEPKISFSCVLDPGGFGTYRWMTTPIEEITKQHPGFVKFRTKNSLYELQLLTSDVEVAKT